MNNIDEFIDNHMNYLLDIDYLINNSIYEYDLSQANIHALLYTGRIGLDEFEWLSVLPKEQREIYIGLSIRNDKTIYKSIQKGIMDAKKMFCVQNSINIDNILSIKNDAIFVIGMLPKITEFGICGSKKFIFKQKNYYSSYYKLVTPNKSKFECYYNYNPVEDYDCIDIKGISDEALKQHEDYFLDFLKSLFYAIQCFGPREVVLDMIKTFYNQYINLELDIGFYREFNYLSRFKIKFNGYVDYYAETLSNKDKNILDISFNLQLIVYLQKIVSSMFFSNRRTR